MVLYEIYSKKSKVTNAYVHGLYIKVLKSSLKQEHNTSVSIFLSFFFLLLADWMWYIIYTTYCLSLILVAAVVYSSFVDTNELMVNKLALVCHLV